MGLDFAIDQLFSTGWSALDTTGCEFTRGGRAFPGLKRVLREFESAGFDLRLRRIDAFDCFRAEWIDAGGRVVGGVVGQTELEAAVYALAQLRRSGVLAATV